MGQGLQVFDGAGNLTLDTKDRLAKVLGTISVSSNGSITVPLLTGNQPFILVYSPNSSLTNTSQSEPIVTISGSTITWTYQSGIVPVEIIYGIY